MQAKGGLPTNMVTNKKNDSHVINIVTRSSQTLGKDVVGFMKTPIK